MLRDAPISVSWRGVRRTLLSVSHFDNSADTRVCAAGKNAATDVHDGLEDVNSSARELANFFFTIYTTLYMMSLTVDLQLHNHLRSTLRGLFLGHHCAEQT